MTPERLRVAARTDLGLSRMTNEDGFLVADLSVPVARTVQGPPVVATLEAGAALAVLDGMGGMSSGDKATRIAADTLAATLTVAPPSGDEAWQQRLVAAMNGASRAILEAVAADPRRLGGIGAAAVAAVISGDRLHLVSAGDCRVYLLRNGSLVQLTRDDTLLNDYQAYAPEKDTSEIPAGVITKALGLVEVVALTPATFELREGDVVLLSTDGLHAMADDASIERVLVDLPDPAEAALALINLANKSGGHDNIAVVVARPEGGALRPPGPADALESRNVP